MQTSTKRILFRCLTLGIAVMFAAILLWPRVHEDAQLSLWSTTFALPSEGKAGPEVPSHVFNRRVALPRSSEAAAGSEHAAREATNDAVHAKLQQWFNSNTSETEVQDAITNELLALLTDDNTATILHALSPLEFNTPFGAKALERWLDIDPDRAARWIEARLDARDEHALLVARRMLETPIELHTYCDRLAQNSWKQSFLRHASLEMASKNPVVAVALAQRLAPGVLKTDTFETIAYDWFGYDLTAAVNWTKSVEDQVLRERLLAVGAKAIAITDPDLAAGWLVTAVKREDVLTETALTLVETWAGQNPQQAANWVARFSDAGPRKEGIDLLLSHWIKSDPASANAWIHTLPERETILAKLKAEQAERERP